MEFDNFGRAEVSHICIKACFKLSLEMHMQPELQSTQNNLSDHPQKEPHEEYVTKQLIFS